MNNSARPHALAILLAATATLLVPGHLRAQSESDLAQFFDGKTVAVKIDMPATKEGVDVFPERYPAVDYDEYQKRLKRYGISLHAGDIVQITKIKVKDKLVEFQLGGGGYGTAGDETGSAVTFTPTPKSAREIELEREIKKETNPKQRKRMQEHLDEMQRDRALEDARLKVIAALAEEQRQKRIHERALESGSRFNIRYPHGVVLETLTPDAVMRALDQQVSFSSPTAISPSSAGSITALHKGMSQEEVDVLLGRPVEVEDGMEGSLKVSRSVYNLNENKVETLFVEGVLVRFTIGSQ